ncbi:MAG: hypothetical protein JXJ04_01100 [Spirochaetales bacterium]|nr:hypothetical protein [Spirochaetales bacterium]
MRLHIVLASLLILLCGCLFINTRKVILVTHKPEILAYAEAFNATQNKYHVEVVYAAEPDSVLLGKGEPADVIIGEWLASPSYMQKCESVNSLLNQKKVDANLFYAELLRMGKLDKEQRVLPLSFTLPCIIFDKKKRSTLFSDIFVPIDAMKTSSLLYNSAKGTRLLKMGFSPLWNDDFIYLTSILFGSDFRKGVDKNVTWNVDPLLKATAFLKNWINEIPGGYSAERMFSKKYLTTPPYQLIKEEKILYYFLESEDLYKIPQEKFEYLDFGWLSYENKIAVTDNILFIGIHKRGRNKDGGKAFISWIFNPVTQEKLLEINHFKKLDGVFGLAGGFSSLKEVNITLLPQHYPLFVNHIPLSESLIFPGEFPDNWQRVKTEQVKSWLNEAITRENFDKKLEEQLNFFQE